MLIFIDSTTKAVVATYPDESLPDSLHPGCYSVIGSESLVVVNDLGQMSLADSTSADGVEQAALVARATAGVVLGGASYTLTWADYEPLAFAYVVTKAIADSSFSVKLPSVGVIAGISLAEGADAVRVLSAICPYS